MATLSRKTIILLIIAAVLLVAAVYLWKRSKPSSDSAPAGLSNDSERAVQTEDELQALQQQLNQLLELREQLEE